MIQGQRPVAALWRSQLGQFLAACNASAAEDQADRLREARALFQHVEPLDAPLFEAMVTARAFESAALAMVGPASGYMLSRGGNGISLASVCLPGGGEQHTCEGDTPALALLAATATALWHMTGDTAVDRTTSEPAWLN